MGAGSVASLTLVAFLHGNLLSVLPQDVGAVSALLRLLLPNSRESQQVALRQPAHEPPAAKHAHPIQHVWRPD